ncbi:MAG: M28 family peptidase [Roseivirga sp.]|nr:M28 family peptidase [Roseivirga sp.]
MTRLKTLLFLIIFSPFLQSNPTDDLINALDIDQIEEHISVLASDDFEGRRPGTKGGKKTVDYIQSRLSSYGVLPVNGESYLQEFKVTQHKPVTSKTLKIASSSGTADYSLNEHFIANTKIFDREISIEEVDVVYVGFGIVSEEWEWDDYEGIDVSGKIVVALYSDPGIYNAEIFKGKAATPHAFIASKKQLALSKGAKGFFTVLPDPEVAAYNWRAAQSRSRRPAYFIGDDQSSTENEIAMSGMITIETFKDWLSRSGNGNPDYINLALSEDFKAESLGLKLSVEVGTEVSTFNTNNVMGMIKGSKRPDEHVIYTAHWDHDGITKFPVDGDSILNGAVDNATGTAMVIETARVFSQLPKKPERSILFFLTAAEEMGLLGAEYYVNNPLLPLHDLVAVINTDASHATHPMREAVNVVRGHTSLDSIVDVSASQMGRKILDFKIPEAGIFKRSDHYPFVKKGIPAVWAVGGSDPMEGDSTEAVNLISTYVNTKYHQVTDEYHDDFLMGNIQMDARFNLVLGYNLASSSIWPVWTENEKYMALRDSMNVLR